MSLWTHPRLQALSQLGTLRAWTGGSRPAPLADLPADERKTVSAFFREQLADWRLAWGELPDADTLRTFWRRARYDAHATHRA